MYLDVSVGLSEYSLPERCGAKSVHEADVERVKVGLNGCPLHDEVLGHPVNVIITN